LGDRDNRFRIGLGRHGSVQALARLDRYVDVGGNSLLLAQVHRKLAENTPGLALITLLHHTTIRALADHLDGRPTETDLVPNGFDNRTAGRARLSRRHDQIDGTR
jgi:hypothetical protein